MDFVAYIRTYQPMVPGGVMKKLIGSVVKCGQFHNAFYERPKHNDTLTHLLQGFSKMNPSGHKPKNVRS